jgi:hypothetical protein
MDDAKGSVRWLPGVAFVAFVVVAGTIRLRAYDLFWHLASGRWIREQGSIPETDPFRFTSDNAPWIDHEWLFQVVLRMWEEAFGLDGLVILRLFLVLALAAFLLYGIRRTGASTSAAILIAALAILGARPRFMLRPELISVVAVPKLLILLQEIRSRRSPIPIVAAVLLVAVWINLHPGALIAPVLAGAFLVGCRLPGGAIATSETGRPAWWKVLAVPAALAAALLVNPAGAEVFTIPFRIGSALRDLPAVNPEWLPLWAAPQPALILGVLGLAALLAIAAVRAGRVDPATGLVALVLAILAASAVRHQGIFFAGAAFLAGTAVADLHGTGVARHGARARAAVATAVCVLAALWCAWPPPTGPLRPRQGPYSFGLGLEPNRYPVEAAERIARWDDLGPLYNDVAFGGYLLWRLYPPRQAFIDGRNEVNPALLREVARGRSDSRAWSELLSRYGIDGALVRYDERLRKVVRPGRSSEAQPDVAYRTSNSLLFPASRFALVHWDDVAMLFVRRTEARAEALAGEEYRFVHPEDRGATLERAGSDPAVLRGALAELDRRLAEDPGCDRALYLRRELERLMRGR